MSDKLNKHYRIKVSETLSAFERQPLIRPFGFKGGYLTELWQVISTLSSASGKYATGTGTQSVLYGDADLFSSVSESKGNELMFAVTKQALELVKTTLFSDPVELIEGIMPALTEKAKELTCKENLNINFIYNALVSVDNAAWLLYAAENGYTSFDEMIPDVYRKALSYRNDKIAIMFQVPYGMPMHKLAAAVDDGYFVIKIKTGAPGSQEEMVRADMERLSRIHQAIGHKRTDHTPAGRIVYTMDANGRYENKATLVRYLQHAKNIGASDHILLYEEPFVESNDENVKDLGVRIAADESIQDESSALRRIGQGYNAIVLKGIAKTLSISLKIAKVAHQYKIPCFCSDLTVNPLLVDWHKNLAARLQPFPEIDMGMMETNGDMNYTNWNKMIGELPYKEASWIKRRNGAFELDKDFYEKSGGIFA